MNFVSFKGKESNTCVICWAFSCCDSAGWLFQRIMLTQGGHCLLFLHWGEETGCTGDVGANCAWDGAFSRDFQLSRPLWWLTGFVHLFKSNLNFASKSKIWCWICKPEYPSRGCCSNGTKCCSFPAVSFCPSPSRRTTLGLSLLYLTTAPCRLTGTLFVFETLPGLAEICQWLQGLSRGLTLQSHMLDFLKKSRINSLQFVVVEIKQ